MEIIGIIVLIFLIAGGFVATGIYVGKNFDDSEQVTQSALQSQTIGKLEEQIAEHLAKTQELKILLDDKTDALDEERESNRKILSQKKSSETRLGQIGEQIAPFLDNCPYDPKDMQFLGNPIDFIVFNYDKNEIVLLEIKTGNSKESTRQKAIKNMVKDGKVYYEKMRINDKGVRTRRENNKRKTNAKA